MLYSAARTDGYRITASDGEIGHVRDLLFDDRLWVIRYLMVDLGEFLPGREVLLAPASIGQWQWGQGSIGVSLTREQIRNSPEVSADLPVSRQHEERLAQYYGWPMYWVGPMYGGMEPLAMPPPAVAAPVEGEEAAPPHDPHLRSFAEVRGYHIQGINGRLGHVRDIFYDDQFRIRQIEIDTRRWLSGRKLIVPPAWVSSVQWNGQLIQVDLTTEQIASLPPFEPGLPADEYDRRLAQWSEEHHMSRT